MHVLAEISTLRHQPEFRETQAFHTYQQSPLDMKKNLLELPSFSIFEQQLKTLSNPHNYTSPFSQITNPHIPPPNPPRELPTPQKPVVAQIAYANNPTTFDVHENAHTQVNHEKQMRLGLEQKVKTLLSGLSSLYALKLPRMHDGSLHESFDPLEILKQIHESMNMTTSNYSHSTSVIPKPIPRHPPHHGHTPHSSDNNNRPEQASALSGLAALSSVMETKEDDSEESDVSPRTSFELHDTRDMRLWWSKYLQVKAIVDDFNMKQQIQQQQQAQQQGNNNNNNPTGTGENQGPKFPNMKDYPHLLNWMNEQVRLYHKGKLPESSHDLLKKLGFGFEIQRVGKNAIWTEYYERLLDIKNRTGSCEIPKDYKDDSLRRWVTNQRQNRKRKALSQSRILLLDQVGFNWGSERKRKREEPSSSAGAVPSKIYETRGVEIGSKVSDEEDEDYSEE